MTYVQDHALSYRLTCSIAGLHEDVASIPDPKRQCQYLSGTLTLQEQKYVRSPSAGPNASALLRKVC